MVPSAERRAHPFPPVEMLLPASVDRFPCFHTCPAYEQKKRAIPGRIFLIAIYIPMVPSATARPQPIAKQGKTSSNIFYLVATSMISAVPARTHFAAGALVFNGAEKTYVGPRRKCL